MPDVGIGTATPRRLPGDRKLYVNPDECIECGACESACPVKAISSDRKNPDDQYLADNAAFFTQALVGLQAPLGTPGSAAELGPLCWETEFVRSLTSGTWHGS